LDIRAFTGTIDGIWDIFELCPQLLSLVVAARLNPSVLPIPFHQGHLLHSCIRRLSMSVDAHPAVIGQFLDGLYLPCLQELQLCFDDPKDEMDLWPGTAILELRKRCLPPLAKVVIGGKFILEEDLVDFLQRMRNLEQLEVMYTMHDLVTPRVRNLLPQDDTAVLRRQSAYWNEVHETMFSADR